MYDAISSDVPNVHFQQGLLNKNDILKDFGHHSSRHLIIILDDLMREVVDSPIMSDFFTINCHHSGCSVVFVSHNIFQQGKYSKSIAVNTGYFIILESPAAMDQIKLFGRQRFPDEKNIVLCAYQRSVLDRPFWYLFVDMPVNVPQDLRIRTDIFPNQETT